MRTLVVIAISMLVHVQALAGDIKDGHVVKKLTNEVEIFDVKAVTIVKQEVSRLDARRLVKVMAILELSLEVEGNVCTADPESVSLVKEWKEDGISSLRLFVTAKHRADPWGPIEACTAHSRISTVKLPLMVDDYLSLPGAPFESSLPKFRVPFRTLFSDEKGYVEVTLTINDQQKLVAELSKHVESKEH